MENHQICELSFLALDQNLEKKFSSPFVSPNGNKQIVLLNVKRKKKQIMIYRLLLSLFISNKSKNCKKQQFLIGGEICKKKLLIF